MKDLETMIDLAQKYADLGTAVTEQFAQVVMGWHNGDDAFEEAVCECNINALALVRRYLQEVIRLADGDVADEASDLDEALASKSVAVAF